MITGTLHANVVPKHYNLRVIPLVLLHLMHCEKNVHKKPGLIIARTEILLELGKAFDFGHFTLNIAQFYSYQVRSCYMHSRKLKQIKLLFA